jgi:hypothetical protein
MGLDNGIIIQATNKAYLKTYPFFDKKNIIKEQINSKKAGTCYEIAYWRKWYEFRDDVVSYLKSENIKDENNYGYIINRNQLKYIIELLKINTMQIISEYRDFSNNDIYIFNNISSLDWLYHNWHLLGIKHCSFYDSY